MARIDRLKEEIGWLKVVFAVSVAIDASLVGWLAQNYATANRSIVVGGMLIAAVLTFGLVVVNQLAYHRMQQLEEA